MSEPFAALVFILFVSAAGYRKISGRTAQLAQIKLAPAGALLEAGDFGRFCRGLRELEFETVGDYTLGSTTLAEGQANATAMRLMLAPERTAYAIVYELHHVQRAKGATTAAHKVWMDLVSLFPEERALTTATTAETLFLTNPDKPVRRYPGIRSAQALWRAHQREVEKLGFGLPLELGAADLVPRFEAAWTRSLEFQESHGLFQRQGDRFVATGKLALRGIAAFWLPVAQAQPWRWFLRFAAVALPAVAAEVYLTQHAAPAPVHLAVAVGAGAAIGLLFHPRIEMWCIVLAALQAIAVGADEWGWAAALFAVAWAANLAVNAWAVRKAEAALGAAGQT